MYQHHKAHEIEGHTFFRVAGLEGRESERECRHFSSMKQIPGSCAPQTPSRVPAGGRGFHNVFERSGFPVLDDKMCVTGLRILTLPQSAHTEPTARAHTTQGVLKTCRYAPFKTKEIQLGLRMGGGGKHFHRNGGFPGPPVVKGLLRPPRQQHSARWQSTHLFLVFTGLSRLY